ncbi:hypothetical protein FB451DRAFT_1175773 [Mycena latifolia]|nr:hypothetical protein FB451DRAFT_1175773 [Mycena latifolia]
MSIFWQQNDTVNDESMWLDLLHHLFKECRRWERIELILPAEAFKILPAGVQFPLLRSLHIGTCPPAFPLAQCLLFQITPRLRRLDITGFGPCNAMLQSWAQLSNHSARDRRNLSKVSESGSCGFTIQNSGRADLSFPTVQCNCLESLTLGKGNLANDLRPLMKTLVAPILRSLSLSDCESVLPPAIAGLLEFLHRSANITSLILHRTSITTTDLIQCLRATPSLAFLDIQEEYNFRRFRANPTMITNEFLEEFRCRPGTENLAKKLVELKIDAYDCLRSNFADCIESRCNLDGDGDIVPMRKLAVKTLAFFRPTDRRLRALETQCGLEYRIKTRQSLEGPGKGLQGWILLR